VELDSFFTAISGVGAAVSAVAAFLSIKDARETRRSSERAADYRRVVLDPSLTAIAHFAKQARAFFKEQRAEMIARGKLFGSDVEIEQQRSVARKYAEFHRALSDEVLDATNAWGDTGLTNRVEYQLDRLDDLAEVFPVLLDPTKPDPQLGTHLGSITSTLSGLIVRHDHRAPPAKPLGKWLKQIGVRSE
jgi:hypothetical protein